MNGRRLLVILTLMVALGSAIAQLHAQRSIDITGFYGEKDGEFFRISMAGEVYQVLWRQKAGDWLGVAIRDGDDLAIGWHRSDGANLGVSFYKIGQTRKVPTLVGGWAAYPGGGIVRDAPIWSRKLN